jgi:hypothetical protein
MGPAEFPTGLTLMVTRIKDQGSRIKDKGSMINDK